VPSRLATGLGPVLVAVLLVAAGSPSAAPGPVRGGSGAWAPVRGATDPALANFSAALQRLVDLVGAAGGALLALVWARVALSWFSNDVAKKIQAKDRARDALIGTLIFGAALTGLIWALAQWVLTGQ
jgi:hypothetical protein